MMTLPSVAIAVVLAALIQAASVTQTDAVISKGPSAAKLISELTAGVCLDGLPFTEENVLIEHDLRPDPDNIVFIIHRPSEAFNCDSLLDHRSLSAQDNDDDVGRPLQIRTKLPFVDTPRHNSNQEPITQAYKAPISNDHHSVDKKGVLSADNLSDNRKRKTPSQPDHGKFLDEKQPSRRLLRQIFPELELDLTVEKVTSYEELCHFLMKKIDDAEYVVLKNAPKTRRQYICGPRPDPTKIVIEGVTKELFEIVELHSAPTTLQRLILVANFYLELSRVWDQIEKPNMLRQRYQWCQAVLSCVTRCFDNDLVAFNEQWRNPFSYNMFSIRCCPAGAPSNLVCGSGRKCRRIPLHED